MSTAEPIPVDLRAYVSFDLDAPTSRRVFSTDVVTVDLVCLEPGQVLAARTLPDADVIYLVIGGRAWLVADDAEVVLEPLQTVLVPAGVPHGVRNESPDPLVLHVMVGPPE